MKNVEIEEIFETHIGTVTRVVNSITVGGFHIDGSLDRDDLMQVALLSAWMAIPHYRAERGSTMMSYIVRCARNGVYDEIRKALRIRGRTTNSSLVSEDEWERAELHALSSAQLSGQADDVEREGISAVIEQDILEVLVKLPRRLQEVVENGFGLGGKKARVGRELYMVLDSSREAVIGRRRRAFAMLRKEPVIQELSIYA